MDIMEEIHVKEEMSFNLILRADDWRKWMLFTDVDSAQLDDYICPVLHCFSLLVLFFTQIIIK